MGLLLVEKTPRPWTLAYSVHRVRAVVSVQFGWLLPLLCGLFYLAASLVSLTTYMPDLFAPRPLLYIGVAATAATLAAAGVSAVWVSIAARLLPWLVAHPQDQASIGRGYRLPERPEFDEPAVVLGEAHSARSYRTSGDYSLDYSTREEYSPTPEWSCLPAKSLVTGLLVLGSIGSGKTAFVLRPSVFKLFHHHTRIGGLVMDSKSALVEPLADEMAAAGRAADLLPIGPNQPTKWNPLHQPLASAATISNSLLTAIENINGSPYSADSRWIRNGAAHLAEGTIGLLRLRSGYVSALAVRTFFAALMAATQGSDEPGLAAQKLIEILFAGCPAPTTHPEEYEYYSGLVIARASEDEKFRAIYISELLSLLVPLTSPDVVGLFNAPEDQLDMPSWSDSINRGLVVVLDCNSRAALGLAIALGMLLKLGYQDAILARLDWVKKGLCNNDRFMSLIVDEYQDFCSPGDSDYLALCRESKSITVFLTQGFASIVQRVGDERSKVILQSLRNRLVLNQTVPEFAADLLGQAEIEEADRSIQESVQDASMHSTGRFAGASSVSESVSVKRTRKHVVPPEELQKLPLGQGILQSHDGDRVVPLHRVFLRSYFAPDTRHADQNKG